MNGLEHRITEQLTAEADRFEQRTPASAGLPWLTPGVRRRVRRRQIGTIVLSLAILAGLAAGSLEAVHSLGRARTTVPAEYPLPTGTQPAPGGWPAVTFGGPNRPEVQYDPGERAHLTGPKTLIAYGTISFAKGRIATWYLDVFEQRRGLYPDNIVVYRTEACDELFVTMNAGGGGGGGCSRVSHSSHPNHPNWMALGSLSGDEPFISYDVVLSTRVAKVEVQPLGAQPFEPRILSGPKAFDERYLVFFAPLAASGQIVAYGPHGEVLQRQAFCESKTPKMWPGAFPSSGGIAGHATGRSTGSGGGSSLAGTGTSTGGGSASGTASSSSTAGFAGLCG